MPQGQKELPATSVRQFALHVATDQVERFQAMCSAIGIAFELGGRVRIRDWRNRVVREGRSFVFRRREDVETVLAYEQFLAKHPLLT